MKLEIIPDCGNTIYQIETDRREYAVTVSVNHWDEATDTVTAWWIQADGYDTLDKKYVFAAAEVDKAHEAAKALLLYLIKRDRDNLDQAIETVTKDFPQPTAAQIAA